MNTTEKLDAIVGSVHTPPALSQLIEAAARAAAVAEPAAIAA